MDQPSQKVSRRGFLGLAAGTGLTAGCGKRLPRYVVPYAIPPDDGIPGFARLYRTVCRECPAACGVTARVREGRVVKLEGNPQHPVNRGALCVRGQAAIEGLYSPDRQTEPLVRAGDRLAPATWDAALDAVAAGIRAATRNHRRVVVLTRPEPGAMGSLLRTWIGALGQDATQVVTFDPMEPTWIRAGARRAFGVDRHPLVDLARAKMLLSIGADLLEDWGSPVEHARGLAALRESGGKFVYVGPRLSMTAGAADDWLSVRPGQEAVLVLGLLRRALDAEGPTNAALSPATQARLRKALNAYQPDQVAVRTGLTVAQFTRLADDFLRAKPSLCIGPGRAAAGADAGALAEAVHVLNAVAGNLGTSVSFLAADAAPWAGPGMSIEAFVKSAQAGEIGALIVHHANPLAHAFAPLANAIGRVPMVAVLTNQLDETAARAHVVLPDHHPLESWGDVSPRPGVRGLQQPVMTPVHATTRAAGDVLLDIGRRVEARGLPDGTFAALVTQSCAPADIERGGNFAEPPSQPVTLLEGVLEPLPLASPPLADPEAFTLVQAPSLRYLDGLEPRASLLQEVPDPVTTIAWGGWVEVSPSTARKLRVATGDAVRISSEAGSIELPAFVYAGVRANVAALPVPFAAKVLGPQAAQLGLLSSVRLEAVARKLPLAQLGGSLDQRGREIAREVVGGESLPAPPVRLSMYPPVEHPVHRWGMAIDLDRCTGCGACVAACYVENNSPVVGATEVARGRDMGWLHIERFIEGPETHPRLLFLPAMCQQCTNAPCESVCPAYATYHTPEGLNAQVYNRCVGTRYCENNCPYGARRFNWFDWPRPVPSEMGLNPDVSVRERGITEKCTFCVQRIRGAEEQARVDERPMRDGDVVTACAQTCPSHAIVFGDLKDPASAVSRVAASGRAYRLLEDLNTAPGVVYLARRRGETET